LAFKRENYDIETWLRLENEGLLQKECNLFDEDGLLVQQFKARINTRPVGNALFNAGGQISIAAPSLYRSFTYDDGGNALASLPDVKEWTQACEDAAQGSLPSGGDGAINVSKSSTTYLYGEVSSVPVGNSVSVYTKQLLPDEFIYFRHVMVGGDCIAKFQVLVNGQPIATKRTWWTKWDTDFWFNTSNGGIIFQSEELIEVRATNLGENLANFEASIGIV